MTNNNIETDEEIEVNGDGYSYCLNDWALNKNIKNDLGLLMIISSLTASKGYCWASNKYLAELFEIDEVSVSRKIKNLEKEGVITIEYIMSGTYVKERKIRLTRMLTVNKNVNGAVNKNVNGAVNKNVKDNNTINNNTIDNNIYKKINKKEYEEHFIECWDNYPKQRIGSKEKAYKSYLKAIKEKRIEKDALLEKIKEYAESEEVSRGYAKGFSAWLNDDRFNCQYKKQENSFDEEFIF